MVSRSSIKTATYGLSAGLALLTALIVRWTVLLPSPSDQCAAATKAVIELKNMLAQKPGEAAVALSEAFRTQSGDAAVLLPRVLRPYGKCEAFDSEAAPLLRFLHQLHTSVQTPALQQRLAGNPPRVLVVGAGPAGLPAALVAHREGAIVTLVEQRTERTRPVWFDLQPAAAADEAEDESTGESGATPTSQEVLRSWGFFELAASSHSSSSGSSAPHAAPFRIVEDERGSGVVTVQCHVLERFLEVCARLVGIDVQLGVAYAGACADAASGDVHAVLTNGGSAMGEGGGAESATSPALISEGEGEPLVLSHCEGHGSIGGGVDVGGDGGGGGGRGRSLLPFDLLIGADGPRSAVRTSVGIGYPAHSAFSSAGGQLVRTRDELSQVSLIVAFALENATGRCPQPRRDPLSGLPDPPYDVSFDEPGVSSVFKRLYEPYCELQILFERDLGERLAATYEAHKHATGLRGNRGASAASSSNGVEAMNAALARALPLPLLLRIANRLFAKPFASEAHLLSALRTPSSDAPPDAVLIRIAIRRATASGRVLLPPPTTSRRAGDGGKPAGRGGSVALALLRGDSLVAPHYRLGVGVNHAMATLPYVDGIVRDLLERGGRAALRGERAGARRPEHAAAAAREMLTSWEQSAGADANALVDYQLGVMYVEVDCSMLVLGERIFQRDPERRELNEVSVAELESLGC